MELRIGIVQGQRELDVDLPDDADPEEIAKEIGSLLETRQGVFWCTDRKGRRIGVAADRIAWVEVGSPAAGRRVGFGAS